MESMGAGAHEPRTVEKKRLVTTKKVLHVMHRKPCVHMRMRIYERIKCAAPQ